MTVNMRAVTAPKSQKRIAQLGGGNQQNQQNQQNPQNPNGLTNAQIQQGYSTVVGNFNPVTGQAWGTPGNPNPNQPIPAGQLQNAQAMNLPQQNILDNQTGTILGNNAGLANPMFGLSQGANGNLEYNTPEAPQVGTPSMFDNFKNFLNLQPTQPSAEKIYNKLPEKKALEQAQKQVQNYASQINAIVSKSQADQISLTGQGRGIPEAIIGGQQAQISREAAIQALPFQALLASAQGNLEMAQNNLDTVFKLRMQDVQNDYDYKTKLLSYAYDFASKSEQRAFDTKAKQDERDYKEKENTINFARDLATQAFKDGNVGMFMQLTSLDPKSPTYTQDIASIGDSMGVYSPDTNPFSSTVDIIGDFEPANVQADYKASLQSLINQGDYKSAYQKIQNTVAKGLTGENKTQFVSKVTALPAIEDLTNKLKAYSEAGGNMGLLKGTQEQIYNKLGTVQDPKFKALATDLRISLQKYRKDLSGAAFSAQEAKDYESVNPSGKNRLNLNLSILEGMRDNFQRQVESTVDSQAESAKYIREYSQIQQKMRNDGVPEDKIREALTFGNKVSTTTGTRAQRNNNPLNIKSSNFTQSFPGVTGIEQKAAADGGNFLTFNSPEAGFNAAKKLITSKNYINLSVDQALKRWSNSGYGGEIVPNLKGKTIKSLNQAELNSLIRKMAEREGYYA